MVIASRRCSETCRTSSRCCSDPPAQPRNVDLDLTNHASKGKATAKLTLVEFSDFQCPFCARHVSQTEALIIKEYVDTGKLRIVFMDFPLENIHKSAFKAAEAARCAGEQGKFWEMHDQLFSSQKTPTDFSNWTAQAEQVGLTVPEFERCLSSGKYAGDIRKDLAQGQSAGITGTPGFFLTATPQGSSKARTLRFISGAQPFASFQAQIDAVLADVDAAND
jgi:protein-disulfide isomerase